MATAAGGGAVEAQVQANNIGSKAEQQQTAAATARPAAARDGGVMALGFA